MMEEFVSTDGRTDRIKEERTSKGAEPAKAQNQQRRKSSRKYRKRIKWRSSYAGEKS